MIYISQDAKNKRMIWFPKQAEIRLIIILEEEAVVRKFKDKACFCIQCCV